MSGENNSSKSDTKSNGGRLSRGSQEESTNRFIVLFRDTEKGVSQLKKTAGLAVVADARDGSISDFEAFPKDGEGVFELPGIDAAIVSASPEKAKRIERDTGKRKAISIIVPDCPMWKIRSMRASNDIINYVNGYRDAVVHLAELIARADEPSFKVPSVIGNLSRKRPSTWGLIETGVTQSAYTGRGIKVAVLDTGFDDRHPDFQGRKVESRSFVESAADTDGHGTHCIGIALGSIPPEDSNVPRYGCAPDAEIYAGKVIYNDHRDDGNDDGFAWLSTVLKGVHWAIQEKCRVINLSLGWPPAKSSVHSAKYFQLFEEIAAKALGDRSGPGTLMVAATGNESAAEPILPACCPSILGIGAVDENLDEALFSNKGADLLAPGVDILSSVPRNLGRYKPFSGTSMAAAHVSGIAALWAEALETRNGEPARAEEIWDALLDNARNRIVRAP